MDLAGTTAAPQGRELARLRTTTPPPSPQFQPPQTSSNSCQTPPAGAQPTQFTGQKEAGPPQKESRGGINIQVSDNKCDKEITNMFNDYNPNRDFEGQATRNITNGALTNIGNAAKCQGSNGHS